MEQKVRLEEKKHNWKFNHSWCLVTDSIIVEVYIRPLCPALLLDKPHLYMSMCSDLLYVYSPSLLIEYIKKYNILLAIYDNIYRILE